MSNLQQWNKQIDTIAVVVLALSAILFSGCETKAKARLQQQSAYIAGQQQAMAQAQAGKTVRVTGDVQNPTIEWTEDLTLAKAIVNADYRGLRDPRKIVVRRLNQAPIVINPRQLLEGNDMQLLPGDVIEILN